MMEERTEKEKEIRLSVITEIRRIERERCARAVEAMAEEDLHFAYLEGFVRAAKSIRELPD